MTTWDHKVDILVRDPLGKPLMAVEVNGRPFDGRILQTPEWRRLLDVRRSLGTPYGMLFSPGVSVLVDPEGKTMTFEGQDVLDIYDVREIPRFQAHSLIETALYTWLADLTLGVERPSPEGFPRLLGDEVQRAA